MESNLLKSVTVKIDNSAVLTQTTIDYTLSPNTTDAYKPNPRWTKASDPDIAYLKARTEHYDCFHPSDPITTYSFTDGFASTQTKKEITESGANRIVVSGKEIRDAVGRVTI